MGIFDGSKDKDELKPRELNPDFSGVRSGGSNPDFSNVRSGGSSTAPAPAAPAAAPSAGTYTVAPGDSLSKIAKKVLGNGNRWPEIYEANKDTIKNPDLIYPGQVLRLPGA